MESSGWCLILLDLEIGKLECEETGFERHRTTSYLLDYLVLSNDHNIK